jgi:hypothetical protein
LKPEEIWEDIEFRDIKSGYIVKLVDPYTCLYDDKELTVKKVFQDYIAVECKSGRLQTIRHYPYKKWQRLVARYTIKLSQLEMPGSLENMLDKYIEKYERKIMNNRIKYEDGAFGVKKDTYISESDIGLYWYWEQNHLSPRVVKMDSGNSAQRCFIAGNIYKKITSGEIPKRPERIKKPLEPGWYYVYYSVGSTAAWYFRRRDENNKGYDENDINCTDNFDKLYKVCCKVTIGEEIKR